MELSKEQTLKLIEIEVKARLLVNAMLRQKHEDIRGRCPHLDTEEALEALISALGIDKNFWER
jgi:hypothetical protein